MAMLTLVSVLYAIVGAGTAAVAALGTSRGHTEVLAVVTAMSWFYLVIQGIATVNATIVGLERRGYRQLTAAEIAPRGSENKQIYQVRILNLQADYLSYNEVVVNERVSHMAVAHRGLRNMIVATGFFVMPLWGVMVWWS